MTHQGNTRPDSSLIEIVDALPDDPAALKAMLIAERARANEFAAERDRLVLMQGAAAVHAMLAEGLRVSTFVAEAASGKIVKMCDLAGLCVPGDACANVWAIFDRMFDAPVGSSSSEITGVHKILQPWSQRLRNKLAETMRAHEARVLSLGPDPIVLFREQKHGVFETPDAPIDVYVVLQYVRDRAGDDWLRVAVTDSDVLNLCSLTGLPLRRTMLRALGRDTSERLRQMRAWRPAAPLSVFMYDVDHFKRINDTHGHHVGDQVLKAVARRIKKCYKSLDDLVCRHGGEEFSAKSSMTYGEAKLLAETACQSVAERPVMVVPDPSRPTEQVPIGVTMSAGYASFQEDCTTPSELLYAADNGLYLAKESGRNRASGRMQALDPHGKKT